MDSIREHLKLEIAYMAGGLQGQTWKAPDKKEYPFLSQGALICPLALAQNGEILLATVLHEIYPWPWRGMATKYHPSRIKPTCTIDVCEREARLNAYWRHEMVAMISSEMNTVEADLPDARQLLMYYNMGLYGKEPVLKAFRSFNELLKASIPKMEEDTCELQGVS